MEKVRYGWKVVRQEVRRSRYLSSHYTFLWYMRRRWTFPEFGAGPLCVFATKRDAKGFMKKYECQDKTFKLFRCKFVKSDEDKVWTNQYPTCLTRIDMLPKGKVLAQKVMLLYQDGEAHGRRK